MRRDFQINSRQLRTLVLLLLLLPLLPTGIMARFMWHTFQEDRTEAERAITRVYQAQLHRVCLAVDTRIRKGEIAVPGSVDDEEAAAGALGLFRNVFTGTRGIRILDSEGHVLAESGTITEGESRVSTPMAAETPGWTVELHGFVEQFGIEIAQFREIWALLTPLVVAAAVFAVTALVAFAVSRQLKMDELKTDFLATVGHELKTPLASSRVLLETLADGNAANRDTEEEYYELLLRENERLGNLVENFLTYQRLVQKKIVLADEEIDAAELARDAVTEMRPRADEKGGVLRVETEGAMGTVRGDRNALITVITSLIDNALKYSEETPDVSLNVMARDESVVFEVADRGIGIPREAAPRVFDQFFQVDQRLSRTRGGCGLGLSIARQIVSAHGGEILLRARKGGGSVFSMVLPKPESARA